MPLLSPALPGHRFSVLVADSYDEEGLRLLADAGPFAVAYEPSISPADLVARAADVDIIVVRSRTAITRDVIEAAPRLRVIGRAGVGLDNVDLEAATRHGVLVMNAPGGNTLSTAEHSFAMMLALARRIPAADASMKAGLWDKKAFQGIELHGKTLGIVGFGRIGRAVARRALAFGMRLLVHDPFVTPEMIAGVEATAVPVRELMEASDLVTVHAPLTDGTRGLIGAAELAVARPHLLLVNCARGGIVDEGALVHALREGRLAGAALDVFEAEPLPADHPLRALPNVILTPHLAASTEEATRQVAIELSRQIIDAFHSGAVQNAANAPNVEPAVLARMRPFLDLAHRVGVVAHHLLPGRATALRFTLAGRAADFNPLTPLSSSFLVGLLQPMFERRINLVNVRSALRELGIDITEARQDDAPGGPPRVEVRVDTAEGRTLDLKATLFEPDLPRLVEINGKRMDAIPDGQLLVLENQDVPGIVGAVTTVLGRHHINISQMTWGRTRAGGEALTVINLDNDVPPAALEEIRGLLGVRHARAFKV